MALFRLIAGLGNPGREYEKTRHNLGFLLIDAFHSAQSGPSPWRERSGALVSEYMTGGEKLILVKPQTFMNRSGQPLQAVMNFYKIEPSEIIVVHDEIDLPFESIRINQGGGAGGHNGVRSVNEALASKPYPRVRMGVGRPTAPGDLNQQPSGEVTDWVLGRFSTEEERALPAYIQRGIDAIRTLCDEGISAAQQQFN